MKMSFGYLEKQGIQISPEGKRYLGALTGTEENKKNLH